MYIIPGMGDAGAFKLSDFGIPSDAQPVASLPAGMQSLVPSGPSNFGQGGCDSIGFPDGKMSAARPYLSSSTGKYYCGPLSLTNPIQIIVGPPDFLVHEVGPIPLPGSVPTGSSGSTPSTNIPILYLAIGAAIVALVLLSGGGR